MDWGWIGGLEAKKWHKNFKTCVPQVKKTGLQPVSRPVERVHYFGRWAELAKSLWCQGFADRLKASFWGFFETYF